jgi:glycosyltransferase involved in cell wall biosynthesis
MKKVLFIVDVRNWAYDDRAKTWKNKLSKKYDIDILYLKDYDPVGLNYESYRYIKELQDAAIFDKNLNQKHFIDKFKFVNKNNEIVSPIFDHREYDGIYIFYSRALCDTRLLATPIPLDKLAIAIRGARAITCCNDYILNEFKKTYSNCFKVTQVVDESIFKILRKEIVSNRTNRNIKVGWSGNYSNPIKNYDLVKKACSAAGVKLYKERELNRIDLAKWYNELDLVVCASKSEGGPALLLEAGAIGIPIVTTRVGLAREIINNGQNGFFAQENAKDIALKIKTLARNTGLRKELSKNLHKDIISNWTYDSRLYEIESVLKEITS